MPKRRILDFADQHVRIPRATYNKIIAVKDDTKCISINKALCLCLEEYFRMKEAQQRNVVQAE